MQFQEKFVTRVQNEVPYDGGYVMVPITDAINAYFETAGIDLQYLNAELSDIPSDIRDDIDTVVSDNEDSLAALAQAEVKEWVQEEKATYAYMLIGRNVWSFQADL